MSFLNQVKAQIKAAFEQKDEPLSRDGLQSLKHIKEELDHLPIERAHYLACFAFILVRVAYADCDVSESEIKKIAQTLKTWSDVTEEQAHLITDMAKVQHALFGGTDNYIVTQDFKEMASDKQRLELLNCMFAVAASDDSISNTESDVIRMISSELGFEHQDFIAARQGYRDKLAALH